MQDAFDPAREGWRPVTEDCFTGVVGPLWHKTAEGRDSVAIHADKRHLNRHGTVHGGLLVALFDESLGAACYKAVSPGTGLVTIHMNSLLLAIARAGDFIVATSEITRQTRSLIFARGECVVNGEKVMTGEAVIKMRRAVAV
jgi:uncharacterized protein (TIGR00369 family)